MTDTFNDVAEALKTKEEAMTLTAGCSMRPMLREHKDIVVIRKLTREPKRGDVLLYRRNDCDKLVLHRLIRVKKDGSMVIRGDNNTFTEYDVKRQDIVGILCRFFRGGKHIDCNAGGLYRLYCFWILNSYHLRRSWKLRIRPFLGRTRRRLYKALGIECKNLIR